MRVFLGAVACALAGYFAVDMLFGSDPPAPLSLAQIEAEISSQPGGALYAVLKSGFPEEYEAHLAEIQSILLDRSLNRQQAQNAVFRASQTFTSSLRRENAHHAGNAPLPDLRAMQVANLAVLESVAEDAGLCMRIASGGAATLTAQDAGRIDIGVMEQSTKANFKAIIAGRDTPQTYEPVSDIEWQVFNGRWRDGGTGSAGVIEAFLQGDTGDARAFCDGAISFQSWLAEESSPLGERILADITRQMMGG